MTALQLIDAALRNLKVLYTGQSSSTDQRSEALQTLQMMLRNWSAERLMVHYIIEQENFTLTSGTAKYTIGSGGTFDTERPVRILGGSIRTSGLDSPLKIIDRNRYSRIANKSLAETPSWLWYNPVYPLGEIYLYPVGGGDIYLDSQKRLTEPSLVTSSIAFAPEYDEAIEYNLTRRLAPKFNRELTNNVIDMARITKDEIMILNASLQVEEADMEILQINRRWSINEG